MDFISPSVQLMPLIVRTMKLPLKSKPLDCSRSKLLRLNRGHIKNLTLHLHFPPVRSWASLRQTPPTTLLTTPGVQRRHGVHPFPIGSPPYRLTSTRCILLFYLLATYTRLCAFLVLVARRKLQTSTFKLRFSPVCLVILVVEAAALKCTFAHLSFILTYPCRRLNSLSPTYPLFPQRR